MPEISFLTAGLSQPPADTSACRSRLYSMPWVSFVTACLSQPPAYSLHAEVGLSSMPWVSFLTAGLSQPPWSIQSACRSRSCSCHKSPSWMLVCPSRHGAYSLHAEVGHIHAMSLLPDYWFVPATSIQSACRSRVKFYAISPLPG